MEGRADWKDADEARAHLDGAVYGQPLLVGQLVIAATENDSLYALDPATGRVIWRRHVGTLSLRTTLPHFSSMSMTGSHAFFGTMDGVIAVGGV
jgi:polyvinyl alcohol dehydrogenase (cytochrome)